MHKPFSASLPVRLTIDGLVVSSSVGAIRANGISPCIIKLLEDFEVARMQATLTGKPVPIGHGGLYSDGEGKTRVLQIDLPKRNKRGVVNRRS